MTAPTGVLIEREDGAQFVLIAVDGRVVVFRVEPPPENAEAAAA